MPPVEKAVAPGRVLDVSLRLLGLVAVHVADHAARTDSRILVGTLSMAGLRSGVLPPLYFAWGPAAWLVPAGRLSGLIVRAIARAGLGRSNRG